MIHQLERIAMIDLHSNASAPRPRRRAPLGGSLVALASIHLAVTPSLAGDCIGSWVQMPLIGPSARAGHAMTYDSADGVVVLEGGVTTGPIAVADTWTWNGIAWTQTAVAGCWPPRQLSGIAYDQKRAETVLFGGGQLMPCGNPARFLGDTWRWNGATWSPIAVPGQQPPSREGPAMCYDPIRERTVLFGGLRDCGTGLNDTWEWNGATWTQVMTLGPGGRRSPQAWFDPMVNRVRIFGGYDGTLLSEMWEWSGTEWSEIEQSGPQGRYAHALAFDEASNELLLFGGLGAAGALNDTWQFEGTQWVEVTSGDRPPRRTGHAMTYDAERAQIILFGGIGDSGPLDDTWIWSPRPVLTHQPASTVTCLSALTTFAIVAEGTGPFTYQWKCVDQHGEPCGDLVDGLHVDPATGLSFQVAGATTPTLHVSDVDLQDHAPVLAFAIVVTNACGASTSAPATLAVPDFNGDGYVDGTDLAMVLGGWGTPSADLSEDGTTDGVDLAILLGTWGDCSAP